MWEELAGGLQIPVTRVRIVMVFVMVPLQGTCMRCCLPFFLFVDFTSRSVKICFTVLLCFDRISPETRRDSGHVDVRR